MVVLRGVAAGLTVVVAAATGVVTNLVTNRWNLASVVALVLLIVLGAIVQIVLTVADRRNPESSGGPSQRATARSGATVIQAGRDVRIAGQHADQPRSAE